MGYSECWLLQHSEFAAKNGDFEAKIFVYICQCQQCMSFVAYYKWVIVCSGIETLSLTKSVGLKYNSTVMGKIVELIFLNNDILNHCINAQNQCTLTHQHGIKWSFSATTKVSMINYPAFKRMKTLALYLKPHFPCLVDFSFEILISTTE